MFPSKNLQFLSRGACLPFHKDPSLHRMNDAPESRLLLGAAFGHAHPPAEGARQPITHLAGHRLRLQVAELILRVQQAPAEKKGSMTHASWTITCRCAALRLTWSHPCKLRPAWRRPAPGSCGAPAGPPHRGPSAPARPSAWTRGMNEII